jgi:glycerol kinase
VSAIREDLAVELSELSGATQPSPGHAGTPVSRGAGAATHAVPGVAGRMSDAHLRVERIRVDGGAAQNNLLMQFQSDISDLCIERPLDLESTARGAAMLAGVGAGIFARPEQAAQMVEHRERFDARMNEAEREEHLKRWRDAVRRSRSSFGLEDDVH